MARETKAKLLAAFSALVITNGYQGTTTRRIAEAAGVNESTLFRHFSTKKDLLLALLKQNKAEMEAAVADFQPTGDLGLDMQMMAKMYFSYVEKHRSIFLLGLRESYAYPELQISIQDFPNRLIELMTKFFVANYHLQDSVQLKQHLQGFFTLLFGRAVLKLTYPTSPLAQDEGVFIQQNVPIFARTIQAKLKPQEN